VVSLGKANPLCKEGGIILAENCGFIQRLSLATLQRG
jgi:hypothetical protein